MICLGLTGGIASGKSTVADLFVKRGWIHLDADNVVATLYYPHSPCYAAIAARFPQALQEGFFRKPLLREIIFNDAQAKSDLEALLYPSLRRLIQQRLQAYPENSRVLLSIPRFYEGGYDIYCDKVIGVFAPDDIRLDRLCARDGISPSLARAMIAAQMPEDALRQRVDVMLENTTSTQTLASHLDRWLKTQSF